MVSNEGLWTARAITERAKEIETRLNLGRASLIRPVWGGVSLPYPAATDNFLAVGAPGSGKSKTIEMLMNKVLRHLSSSDDVDTRALIYDHKQNTAPLLTGMRVPFKIINPTDARTVAWDVGRDLDEPAHAAELANLIVPQDPNAKEDFYRKAARHLIEATVLAF